MPLGNKTNIDVPYFTDGGGQTVSIGSSANRSSQLTVGQDYIVIAEADCYLVSGGSAVDATTSDFFLPSYTPVKFTARSGLDYVSVIRKSTDVTNGLHICEA